MIHTKEPYGGVPVSKKDQTHFISLKLIVPTSIKRILEVKFDQTAKLIFTIKLK